MEQRSSPSADQDRQRRGAVILCGGGSRRMGRDKAWLPFGPETMLQRVVRLASEVAPLSNIIVVASAEQQLPDLPDSVEVLRDLIDDQGPLSAIIEGLRRLAPRADAALVTSCDAPLLVPKFADFLFQQLTSDVLTEDGEPIDAIVPTEPARLYPMSAAYRTSCHAALEVARTTNLLKGRGESIQRAFHVPHCVNIQYVPVAALRSMDPELHSLINCNTPEDYQHALQLAGLMTND